MDTTVKCTRCFAHVDGFYTDSEGKRLCKPCEMKLAGTVELAHLRAVADAARVLVADADNEASDNWWTGTVFPLYERLAAALDALDGED